MEARSGRARRGSFARYALILAAVFVAFSVFEGQCKVRRASGRTPWPGQIAIDPRGVPLTATAHRLPEGRYTEVFVHLEGPLDATRRSLSRAATCSCLRR